MPISRQKMKKANAATVFSLIRYSEGISRNAIAQITALSPSTITLIVDDLIKRELVEETEFLREPWEDAQIGRHPIGLKVCEKKYKLIGLEYSEASICAGLFDFTCAIPLKMIRRTTSVNSSPAKEAIEIIHELIADCGVDNIVGVGLGVPGVVDVAHKNILLSIPMQAEDINIGEEISHAVGLPVFVENESKLMGLYEKQKYYQDVDTFVYISVSTGIGGCIIKRNKFLMGGVGTTGEIGHMSINYSGQICHCGNHGCLETYASTKAMIEQASKRMIAASDHTQMKIREIADAFHAGDKIAAEIVMENAGFLAVGMINLVNLINPTTIVVGGDVLAFGERYFDEIKRKVLSGALRPYSRHVDVIGAHAFDIPVASGAAMLAADELIYSII